LQVIGKILQFVMWLQEGLLLQHIAVYPHPYQIHIGIVGLRLMLILIHPQQ
jgi:hypothetical protein